MVMIYFISKYKIYSQSCTQKKIGLNILSFLKANSLVAQSVKDPPAMQETWVPFLGWEDPLERGKGTPLQYSGLENSVDSIVPGVAKSWTRLSDFHFWSWSG